ncbi:MAG TPA: hypothetical protein VN495_03005, partial [Candidatus Paceibacterota bacterium]|nr:hypothetical protein [Candidatus Paceibacterota bacterium]
MISKRTLFYVASITVIVLLGALTGFYLFLHGQTAATNSENAARGLNSESPIFANDTGSTANFSSGALSQPTAATSSAPMQRLWHVDGSPVAGMAFATSSASLAASTSAPSLYYAQRASGYL